MTAATGPNDAQPLFNPNGDLMSDTIHSGLALRADDARGEPYRPRYHYTPGRNWMNDPNGLVYFEGEYHLFYQYNPQGIDWGHMSWGHAVSTDLVDWTELPVAIPETDKMIFSGCALIDWENVSGLGEGGKPPMLAYFTAYDEASGVQSQHLAYSIDRGRSFEHYRGNPLIDLGLQHFRDPKVFWHEESGAWVMVVALSRDHKVQFYRSTNLLDWSIASEFGPAGSTSGQWECPDFVEVPIEGEAGGAKWVLKVDVDQGFVAGGSGAQYFVGDFDGYRFTIDPRLGSKEGETVDFGTDFYAAVTWSDLPAGQPGPLWIGWMSNHQTGKTYPTHPWRGVQSIPRTLFLFEARGKLKLGQRPVPSFEHALARDSYTFVNVGERGCTITPKSPVFHARIQLDNSRGKSSAFEVSDGRAKLLQLSIDGANQQVTVERFRNSPALPEDFAKSSSAMLHGAPSEMDIYFDGCVAEIFINVGRLVCSTCVFPDGAVTMKFAERVE